MHKRTDPGRTTAGAKGHCKTGSATKLPKRGQRKPDAERNHALHTLGRVLVLLQASRLSTASLDMTSTTIATPEIPALARSVVVARQNRRRQVAFGWRGRQAKFISIGEAQPGASLPRKGALTLYSSAYRIFGHAVRGSGECCNGRPSRAPTLIANRLALARHKIEDQSSMAAPDDGRRQSSIRPHRKTLSRK